MFHWICPECGQEIAPGVKECPVCDPQPTAALTSSNGPLATVTSPRDVSSPTAPPPAKSPEPQVIRHPEIIEPEIVEPEKILQPEILQPEIILAKAQTPAAPIPITPGDAREPLLPEEETFSDRLADLAQRLHGSRMPYGAPRIIENTSAPRHETERAPTILDVIPTQPLLAAPPVMRLLAEPQPPSIAVQIPPSRCSNRRRSRRGRRLAPYPVSPPKPRHPPRTRFNFPASPAAPRRRHWRNCKATSRRRTA